MFMRNISYALRRLLPTAGGMVRIFFRSPLIAMKLFVAAACYTLKGKMPFAVIVEKGYPIEHPKELVAYLAHFVEREIESNIWLKPYRAAENPLCLDVGGHAGIFSLKLLCENPTAIVQAYEPQRELFAKALAGLAEENERYSCFNIAISDRQGSSILYLDSRDNSQASLEMDWRPGGDGQCRVDTFTLDEVTKDIGKIFLIKVDVEGHEDKVIAGAREALSKARFLLVEILRDDNRRTIRELLGPTWSETRLGEGDYLFERAGD